MRISQRSALYDRKDLDAAVDRAAAQGWPGPTPPDDLEED